jgi:hypothetical protein
MKKLLYILVIFALFTSCSVSKEAQLTRSELRKDKKIAEQAIVKKAVESRRYIIKLDRMYYRHGGFIDLYPRANYIIIDGNKAAVSMAYIGRQFDIRPIAGINIIGRPLKYELTNDVTKGSYHVKTEVDNGNNSFDLYLTIGKGGYCSVSMSNMKLDYVTYKGYLVPIKEKVKVQLQDTGVL